MAGDWIKFEATTPDKPEVVQMAAKLGIDQDAVIGKLLRLWVWADQNSVDGNAATVTSAFLDRLAFCQNFAIAMRDVGWLIGDDGALTFPNFDRHNGKTAKARAIGNRRVVKHRACNGEGNDDVTLTPLHKPLQKALPEKRREEKKKELKDGVPSEPRVKLELPDWLPADAWSDWHAFRNSRKGWTPRARELSLSTLSRLRRSGHDPRSVIDQSIERGWTGLFEIKGNLPHDNPARSNPSAVERVRDANRKAGFA